MSVKIIKQYGDQVLRTPCIIVDLTNLESVFELIDDLKDTMRFVQGVGLAANQIGDLRRVFVMVLNNHSILECINPEIISQYDEVEFDNEGCLSIPGTTAKTKRFQHVEFTYIDKTGEQKHAVASGNEAYAIQHEMEHLNGKLYVDQFGSMRKAMILSKHVKYIRQVRRS